MCGIVGGVGNENIVPIIINGLFRLEYRGYDSAGVIIINDNNQFQRKRTIQRVKQLSLMCDKDSLSGKIGVGHTRWATHGAVNVDNAHPHLSMNKIAIVHNGIIENYSSLKKDLQNKGYEFKSSTDTEVIVHLIHSIYLKEKNLLKATQKATKLLIGAYAIAVITNDAPNSIVCAKVGCPMIIGIDNNQMFFASDISAILSFTNKVVYLEDGDSAILSLNSYKIYDKNDNEVKRKIHTSGLKVADNELGIYKHYMQKEIFEQPQAVANTILHLGNHFNPEVFTISKKLLKSISAIQIIACGTSFNAGLIAKYLFEEYAKINCMVDIASEFRYKSIVQDNDIFIINISQSGETADTIASMQQLLNLNMDNTLSICNVEESTLQRMSKYKILTKAGPEIGVASTKAFTTQLIILLYFVFTIAKAKNLLSTLQEKQFIDSIRKLPAIINNVLINCDELIKDIAKQLKKYSNLITIGRNVLYPIAIEGALKIKEISYIHAESYAAGELKHGPFALIDKNMPVIALMSKNVLYDKIKSNIEEILARDGVVYLITDTNSSIDKQCKNVINIDTKDIPVFLLPIIYVLPLQLLSYYTALYKGTDVDKPRNLAKSVTVE